MQYQSGYDSYQWVFDWVEYTEEFQEKLANQAAKPFPPDFCGTCARDLLQNPKVSEISEIFNESFSRHGDPFRNYIEE